MNADRVVLAQATATAWASVSVPLPDIDALRAKPGPPIGKAIGPKTLRFADEQTVAGMSAILQAIHARGWQQESFADWGVLSAPRFLGRMITAFNISRTMLDPAFSISPHIIPNFCLHSVSGAVSVALGIHGPNFGIGGGPDAVPEGIMAALSVLAEKRVPGVWLILSDFDPEPIPDADGHATNAVVVHAVALALQPAGSGLSVTAIRGADATPGAGSVRALGAWLRRGSGTWVHRLDGLGRVELVADSLGH